MIYFRDPEKDAKLKEAITQHLGQDGVYTYSLTPTGMLQWNFERMHGK